MNEFDYERPATDTRQSLNILQRMRRTASIVFVILFWLAVPIAYATALMNENDIALPVTSSAVLAVLGTALLLLPMHRSLREQFMAVLSMASISVLVMAAAGSWQIEFHFFYFAALAMLTVYCNPAVIVTAALTVVVHHLALSYLLPDWIFSDAKGDLRRVLFHGTVVLLETGVLIWLGCTLEETLRRVEAIGARNAATQLEMHNLRRAHARAVLQEEEARRIARAALEAHETGESVHRLSLPESSLDMDSAEQELDWAPARG